MTYASTVQYTYVWKYILHFRSGRSASLPNFHNQTILLKDPRSGAFTMKDYFQHFRKPILIQIFSSNVAIICYIIKIIFQMKVNLHDDGVGCWSLLPEEIKNYFSCFFFGLVHRWFFNQSAFLDKSNITAITINVYLRNVFYDKTNIVFSYYI